MLSRCLDRLEAKRIILRCSADLISACGRLTNAAKAWRNPLWRKLSGFFSSPSRFSPTCGGRKTSTAKQGVSLKGNGHDSQEIPQIACRLRQHAVHPAGSPGGPGPIPRPRSLVRDQIARGRTLQACAASRCSGDKSPPSRFAKNTGLPCSKASISTGTRSSAALPTPKGMAGAIWKICSKSRWETG